MTSTRQQPVASTSKVEPLSVSKSFRPYFNPIELAQLNQLQAARKDRQQKELSEARVDNLRQLACGFIEKVGGRLGFPRRTIATAQTVYHRFHLFFPLRDFSYHDVSISALLVASKLEDTLKKLREIQIAASQILSQLEGGNQTGDGDTVAQEAHRPQLIAIERLILQTICFNFNLHRSPFSIPSLSNPETTGEVLLPAELGMSGKDVFGWVIRIAREMGATKEYTFLAHLLAIDVHRTLTPLSYPPHTVALACLYLASFLLPQHPNSMEWRGEEVSTEDSTVYPKFEPGWTNQYESVEEDVSEIAQSILNLFIQLCPSGTATYPSPSYSPASASPSANSTTTTTNSAQNTREKNLYQTGIPHSIDGGSIIVSARREEEFTRIKIKLRETEKIKSSVAINGNKRPGEPNLRNGSGGGKRVRPERWVGSLEGFEEMTERKRVIDEAEKLAASNKALGRKNDNAYEKGPLSVLYRF